MCRQIERARDKGDYMRNVARQSHHAVYFSFFIVGFRKRRLSARIVRVYGGAGIGIRKAGRLRGAVGDHHMEAELFGELYAGDLFASGADNQ